MFDRLEDLVRRLEELNIELTDPDTISNQEKYRQLMKEQNELTPIVEKYQEYMVDGRVKCSSDKTVLERYSSKNMAQKFENMIED